MHALLSIIFALLLVVFRRMFSPHVSLEARRCGALEIAVSTAKRLLTSVRSVVYFETAGFYARIVALVTLKRLLS